ncbi:hypothetical protein BGX23_011958 [Mortierella sp. AD031]|nr:hypothetical protein BGX23_011958 [Mortierella sp. AD031]
MRFSVVALVAALVAVSSAQDIVDPTYPFKPNGPCVDKCLNDIGKKLMPGFTSDPKDPKFLESLGYAHDRGTPKYTAYMNQTGLCISSCPREEQNLYSQQYKEKNAWYVEKKAGGTPGAGNSAAIPSGGASATPSGGASATPSGGASATTTGGAKPTGGAGSDAAANAASGLVSVVALLGAVALL